MEYNLVLHSGAPVMIVHNLNVPLGIVNGKLGHVRFMGRKVIVLECKNQQTGALQLFYLTISRELITYNTKQYVMYNFPLRVAYSATVHKVQGLTLPEIAVDCSNFFEAGSQAYVAISRCTKLEGVHLSRVYFKQWVRNPDDTLSRDLHAKQRTFFREQYYTVNLHFNSVRSLY